MAASRELALPLDIVPLIFEQIDDLATLSNIVEAFPGLLEPMLERRFDKLVPSLLKTVWPEEMLGYAYAALRIEDRLPKRFWDLKTLMQYLIEGLRTKDARLDLPGNLQTVKRLAKLTETIAFLVPFSTALWLENFDPAKRMPPSPSEDSRVQRALRRFQLYAQLFHQHQARVELISDIDWEYHRQAGQFFWKSFTGVEVEECKCIYVLLVNVLWNMRPIQPSKLSRKRFSQPGLPLPCSIFSDSIISIMASSYAERFADYAFTGLSKVDPMMAITSFYFAISKIRFCFE